MTDTSIVNSCILDIRFELQFNRKLRMVVGISNLYQ